MARRGEIFALSGIGLLLGIAVVCSWGRLGPEPGSRNPTDWLGLLAVVAPHDASKAHLLFLMVPALSLLMLCWWHLLRLAAGRQVGSRAAAVISVTWSLPFAIGPVIGSRDAYAYVAQGELARRGLDPSRAVVSQLGPGRLLDAVDPRWRDTRPPYGGVAVALQKAAAAAGHPTVSLVVLRLVALAAVALLIFTSARMVSLDRRASVIAAIGANPLVLVHLVAGAHLDAVAAALLVAGLALARGGGSARHWLGVMVCTLGAMVKLPVALGAGYLAICALLAAGPGLLARLRSLATDGAAIVAAIGLSMALSGGGLGWVHNFGTPGRIRTGIAPADLGANLVRGLGWLFGLHSDGSGILNGARLIAAAIGALLAARLLLPRRRRGGGWRAPTLDQLGLALLGLGLLGPVLYGWYLAPVLPLLALAGSRIAGSPIRVGELPAGVARSLILILSVVLTFATVPSLAPAWSALDGHPALVAGASASAALVLVASLILGIRALVRARASRLEQPPHLARPAAPLQQSL